MDGGVEVGTDGEVAAILEVEGFEEEAVHARLVLRLCVVELDEVFGSHGAFTAEVEVNAAHEFLVLSHVVGEERLVALSNGCADAALYLFGQLSGGFARFASSLGGIVVRGGCHDDVHIGSIGYFDTRLCLALLTVGHDFEGSVVANDSHAAAEACARFCVSHFACANLAVGLEAYEEFQFVVTLGFVVSHEHLVGGRSEVATRILRQHVSALVLNATHTAHDVEVAGVVLHGLGFVVSFGEYAAHVGHFDRAEVLEVALVAVGIVTGPEGLFVELDVVHLDSTLEGSTELSVTYGQCIFHPSVAHARLRGRHVVPECPLADPVGACALVDLAKFAVEHVGIVGEVDFGDENLRALVTRHRGCAPEGEPVFAVVHPVVRTVHLDVGRISRAATEVESTGINGAVGGIILANHGSASASLATLHTEHLAQTRAVVVDAISAVACTLEPPEALVVAGLEGVAEVKIAALNVFGIEGDVAALTVLHGVELRSSIEVADVNSLVADGNDSNLAKHGGSREVCAGQFQLSLNAGSIAIILAAKGNACAGFFRTQHYYAVSSSDGGSLFNLVLVTRVCRSPIVDHNTSSHLATFLRVHTIGTERQFPRIVGIANLLHAEHGVRFAAVGTVAVDVLLSTDAVEIVVLSNLFDAELLVGVGFVLRNGAHRRTCATTDLIGHFLAVQQERTRTCDGVNLVIAELTLICHLLRPSYTHSTEEGEQH